MPFSPESHLTQQDCEWMLAKFKNHAVVQIIFNKKSKNECTCEGVLDERVPDTHSWPVTTTAKPVVRFQENFVHPFVLETHQEQQNQTSLAGFIIFLLYRHIDEMSAFDE